MTIESVNLISDLDQNNPAGGDSISEGDDHIRNIKRSLKNTFPNVTAQVTATADDINKISDLAANGNGVFASCKFNGSAVTYGHNISGVTVVDNGQYLVNFAQPADGFDSHYAIQVTPIATTNAVIACVNDQDADHVQIAVREESGGSWGIPSAPVGFYLTMVDMIQTEANANP